MSTVLTEGLTRHHRTLDKDLLKARHLASVPDREAAQGAFNLFRTAIENHMTTEETTLFPVYEAAQGKDNALTAILRKGHRDLRGFFEEIVETLSTNDSDETLALMDIVAHILHHHDEKEEQEFYPAVAPFIAQPEDVIAKLAT